MTFRSIEGFLNNPFFIMLNTGIETVEQLKSRLEQCFKHYSDYSDYYFQDILDIYQERNKIELNYLSNERYVLSIKQVFLDYLVLEDALKYFVDGDEDLDKVYNIIKRHQNANLVNNILGRVMGFIRNFSNNNYKEALILVLNNDIKRALNSSDEKFILDNFGSLKQIVDKISSGVKQNCYLDFYKQYGINTISKELNNYIIDKYGYDLTDNYKEYFLYQYSNEQVLSLALCNDSSIWEYNSINKKTFLSFLALVEKYNDIAHAKKIVDYAFREITKDEKLNSLYEHKFPLYYKYDIEKQVCEQGFQQMCLVFDDNINIKNDIVLNGFVYPIYPGYEQKITEGKKIFKEFLLKAYPNDIEQMNKIFSDLNIVIQDEEVIIKRHHEVIKKEVTLRQVIDNQIIFYEENSKINEYLNAICNGYSEDKNVLNRLYYRIYLIKHYKPGSYIEYIYEYLYNILNLIDTKFKTKCSFIYDNHLREENYQKLKELLNSYSFNIKDEYKALYVSALLDRKYATTNEINLFAELEQLGDAVYELAVDNILFYNLDMNEEIKLSHQTRENYVKADAQIKVSKFAGFDQLYISNLHNSLNKKYLSFEKIEEGVSNLTDSHYLADSLEMIIGALTKEFGIQKILNFVTKIIVETNKELKMPHFLEFDINKLYDSGIDKDYLDKIYPTPFKNEDYLYWDEYSQLSYAIVKLINIMVYGNETKEKRKKITHSIDQFVFLNDDKYSTKYSCVISYLYNGIEETIDYYKKNYSTSLTIEK